MQYVSFVCVVQEGQAGGGGDILVTAASRGIIQREHQRAALFYKNYALANPFDNITKHDLDDYKREVERKEKRRAGQWDEGRDAVDCEWCVSIVMVFPPHIEH